MTDLSLFPRKEEWGSGDEALDNKLSSALKKATTDLSFKSISEFYFFGMSLKPRAYNPGFLVNIELVTKALFYLLDPLSNIDYSIKKMKGDYYAKIKIPFIFKESDLIINELKSSKVYRYLNQIDFSLITQSGVERNPFVREELKRSKSDLSVKIIFKEFKNFLNAQTKPDSLSVPFSDSLFLALRGGVNILVIEDFAEIWFHQDQIYSLSLMSE